MYRSQNEAVNADDKDVLKIMIATDNHLGYNEKDNLRGDDSFIAFEEILEIAIKEEVDLILLGGDLFHDATPSQNTLNKCIKLLKRVVLGDKPISVEFLSDQTTNFMDCLNQTVNYEDPNLNISLPVFSIHGNHDDPSGFGRLSSLDLLSSTGLINYFGRWVDLTKVVISPILLKKGVTKIALYGLSHIHDARLARLFRESKVVMETPAESNEWFNLMVLHQNRVDRGPTNYLPEDILPTFLDLVIWGHEHDCRIFAEENSSRKFFVSQPGSSVATSLSESESLPKHCGILEIYKKDFKINAKRLKTVRPFVFQSIDLIDFVEAYKLDEGNVSEKVIELAKSKIAEMIERANDQISDEPRQPKLPLIRLRIIYIEEDHMFNTIRFGQLYNSVVANPQDMVHFKKQLKKINKNELKPVDKHTLDEVFNHENINNEARVEDIVDRYFNEVNESEKLQIMFPKILSEMCFRLVERNDSNAADKIINYYKDRANEYLLEKLPNEDDLNNEICNIQNLISKEYDNILKMLDDRTSISRTDFTNKAIGFSNLNDGTNSNYKSKSANENSKIMKCTRKQTNIASTFDDIQTNESTKKICNATNLMTYNMCDSESE